MTTTLYRVSLTKLTDEFGQLSETIRRFEDKLAAIKEELISRDVEKWEGDFFTITRNSELKTKLDEEAVKAKVGLKWYQNNTKSHTTTKYHYKRKLLG